jgi:hypothetical protein
MAALLLCVGCAFIFASVMIVLAQVASKDAAKCGMHCELRISVNELNFERIVQLWDIPKGEFDSCLGNMSHATQLLCALFVPACDDWCKLNGILCACVHRFICKLWICCFVQLN